MSLFPHGHRSGLFIWAEPRSVVDCLIRWGNEEIVGRHVRAEMRSTSLEHAWQFVDEDRKFNPDRAILISVGSGWAAFFDNHFREFVAQAKLASGISRSPRKMSVSLDAAGLATSRDHGIDLPGVRAEGSGVAFFCSFL